MTIGAEDTLIMCSIYTLWMVLKVATFVVKCATHTLYMGCKPHLHHEVSTDHFLYSGQCTPALLGALYSHFMDSKRVARMLYI